MYIYIYIYVYPRSPWWPTPASRQRPSGGTILDHIISYHSI